MSIFEPGTLKTTGPEKEIEKVSPIKEKPQGSMPKSDGKLYPPFAHVMVSRMKTKGKYEGGWPKGAIVHFTAGRDGAEKTIKHGIGNGYAYWCLQRDGKLFCAHPANEWGYHAGESKWKTLLGAVSDDLIGIEINAAGRVSSLGGGKYKTWFGETLDESEVRYTPGVDNQLKGHYHKFTSQQEDTLIKTLLWLKAQNPAVFSFEHVLGHDEVAGMKGLGRWRKNDPGAALSMTMTQFRMKLSKLWLEMISSNKG
jgi:N-acetyl-anhydromuramyl-L-alanine amidase AmpD